MSRRMWALAGAIATAVVGMIVRGIPVAGDALGGTAYTVLIALLIVTLRPATTPVVAGLGAFLVSCAIELLQLTSLPRTVVEQIPPARWVLGSTFNPVDLLWYAVGGLVAVLACRWIEKNAAR